MLYTEWLIDSLDIIYHIESLVSGESLWNAAPFLFSNAVLVNVDIITKCIHVSTKYQWSIHEWTWINKLSLFLNLHFLDVEYEASIEDLLGNGTLSTKNHDFIVCDLVRKTHVSWNPMRFVDWSSGQRIWSSSNNLLPDILGNIITFNCINDVLLINSTTECKNEVIFESTECNSRSSDS